MPTIVGSKQPDLLRGPVTGPVRLVRAAEREKMLLPHDSCQGTTAKEQSRFVRIAEASRSIKRHQDLHLWLQGEIQHFIRHEVLIAACGYFDTWQLKLDVTSSLPGVRTHLLEQGELDGTLKALFGRWVENERRPFVLDSLPGLAPDGAESQSALHAVLRNAKSVLVHGVRDERGDSDCLYLALHSASFAIGCMSGCFSRAPCVLIDSLITQIDIASRRLAPFPGVRPAAAVLPNADPSGLSEREREIMEWICRGKTNLETGVILNISSFTVKNHIQRIFKKIGANNRVHAVAIYKEQFAQPANGWRR